METAKVLEVFPPEGLLRVNTVNTVNKAVFTGGARNVEG